MPSVLPATEITPVIDLQGPTVIAFFVPSSDTQSSDDEPLDDFQWYAMQAAPKLQKAGVHFEQVYARAFRLRLGSKVKKLDHFKEEVGYYFVAPGKAPRIEYGVLTDADLLQIANTYFATTTK